MQYNGSFVPLRGRTGWRTEAQKMKDFLQVLLRFIPPYKKYLVGAIAFNILSALLNVFSFATLIPMLQILFKVDNGSGATQAMAWSDGSIKDVLSNNVDYYTQIYITSWGPTTVLLVIGAALAFMTFLKTGAYFLSSASIIPIRTGVVRDIRNQLYQKITSLSLGFFSEERKGDIIARMSGDVQEIDSSIMASLDMLFKNPILIIIYFATLLAISWQLTLFTIVFVPVFGWFMGVVGRKLKAKSIKAQALWSDTMSQVEETLGGLRIIKAFCAEDKMNARFAKVNDAYRDDILKVNVRQQMAHPMSEFLGTVMIVIVLWFGGTLVLAEYPVISGPTFIYYLVILYSIINPLKDFSKASYNIPKGLASMERVDKILKAEVEIQEKAQPEHISSFEHEIEFRHVSFAYNDHGKQGGAPELHYVLRDINLVIPKGKTIALVGQSGSGKSTITKLLLKYYEPEDGEIDLNGVNLAEYTNDSVRRAISYVPQNVELFSKTIFENIRISRPEATLDQVREAAKKADAHEFIRKLPLQYNTYLEEAGNGLSGGEKQRLALARAFLKDANLYILDESTSSLDFGTENTIFDMIYNQLADRSMLIVAHRLSTIRDCDLILVMDHGEIVERGTHEELLAKQGKYYELWSLQQGIFRSKKKAEQPTPAAAAKVVEDEDDGEDDEE